MCASLSPFKKKKKKRRQGMNGPTFSPNPRMRGKCHHHHMYGDCPKTKDIWLEVQAWLHTNFKHCTLLEFFFLEQLIILGSAACLVTDRIQNLCILIIKIFTSKLRSNTPHRNVFLRSLKSRFSVEKHHYMVNSRPSKVCLA